MGKEIAVELKNDVALTGTLHSVDQYLNVKLTDVNVVDAERYPQLVGACVLGLFIGHICIMFILCYPFGDSDILVQRRLHRCKYVCDTVLCL